MPQLSKMSVENSALRVTLEPKDGTLAVLHKRNGRTWAQAALAAGAVQNAEKTGQALLFTWCDRATGLDVHLTLALDGDKPEFVVRMDASGEFSGALAFPHPFLTDKSTYLVVPMNEGISYPVDDETVEPLRLIDYGGHGICMAFWGATTGAQGYMAIVETSDDAATRILRQDGRLVISPEWDPQKGRWGYTRTIRYVFLEQGGHVAMAKRYREYARSIGRVKTLAEKAQENPNVDKLLGAANVWCWEKDALSIAKGMRAQGLMHVLWSETQDPATIDAMNEMGWLTSTYDLIQDVMDPANYDKIRFIHGRWPKAAWPKDLMLGPDGDWIKGWKIEGKEGGWYPCGVTCDRQAPQYERGRLEGELPTLHYNCRFQDTTTATPWRECYHPDHPLTRTESREWKMELLRLMSQDFGLVTGTETGHDAAIPYAHYFEGMLSLGPYRVPDAGRKMQQIWDEVPERVAKYQVGQRYRLPLFELVYHDCFVAHWYWGDYNNKLPAIWDKRDLFNQLYGTAPMYMFNRELWMKEQERFVASYKRTCPLARKVGYAEMTDHRFLTPDRDVQQTVFSNGVTVTVNFGEQPFTLPDGTTVAPMGSQVVGM